MANVNVEKEGGERSQLVRREHWDPFRSMRDLIRWDPFGEGLFAPLGERGGFMPAFEIKENKDAFEFKADLPGVDAKDIDVKLSQNRLTISGKREAEKTDKGDTYYTYERSYGSFSRSFTVPEGVDAEKVQADLRDGVLKVIVPKKPEVKPRQVQVKSA